MAFGKGSISQNPIDFYNKTTDLAILTYYLGITTIPCLINSPLRKDKNPSLGLFSHDGIRIGYHDFSTRETGGTIRLLSKLWHYSYTQTLERIQKDVDKFGNSTSNLTISERRNKSKKVYSKTINLECRVRNWEDYDQDYWGSFGISLSWLKFGEVYPISHIIVTKNNNRYVIPADKYAYSYVEYKDMKVSLKIYQPFNNTHKWSNKHDASVWDLWLQLPKSGEKLIITSSRKDALCVWENTGIPCCSLQAESYLPKPHIINQLKERFQTIYVLYDNDYNSEINYGHLLGESMAKEFNLKQIEIPSEFKSKDPSDLYKNHGQKVLQNVILQLCN